MGVYYFEIFAFVFGTLVGSFANLCIYRLPRALAVALPRSRCVQCGMPVAWYDNIPIVSFVILKGRCRCCGIPFGVSHLLIEVIVGIAAWWIYRNHGIGLPSFYLFALFAALLIVSAIDLDHRIIPDVISIPGIWLGAGFAALSSWLGMEWFVTFTQSILGILVGGGLLWGVGFLYEKITGREGIGFGDVKLLALFGANTGIEGVLTSLFFGSFLGSLVGLFIIVVQKKGRRTPIPFGPFLCAGLLIYAFGGDEALYWVLSFR